MNKFYANYKGEWYGPYDTYPEAVEGWHSVRSHDSTLWIKPNFKPSYVEEFDAQMNSTGKQNFAQRKEERKKESRKRHFWGFAKMKRKHKCHCKEICGGKIGHNMDHLDTIAREQIKEYKNDL